MPQCTMPETPEHASAAAGERTVLDQSPPDQLERLYRAAVGTIASEHYPALLARFEAAGRATPGWNWAAALCTFDWMLFRGLWLPALLYLLALAAAVATLAGAIALAEPPLATSLRWGLWAALATVWLLLPGLFGNAWLYRAYRQRVARALAGTASLDEACALLARAAGTRRRLRVIVAVNLMAAALLALGLWWSRQPVPLADGRKDAVTPAVTSATLAANTRPTQAAASVGAAANTAAPSSLAAASSTAAPSSPATAASAAPNAPDATAMAANATATPAEATASPPQASSSPAAAAVPASASVAPRAPTSAPGKATDGTVRQAEGGGRRENAAPARHAAAAARFLVNVGLFAQPQNAQRAQERLTTAGLPVIRTELNTRAGPRSRVRVGPFTDRDQAEAAARQIRALQLEAVVIEQKAPARTP